MENQRAFGVNSAFSYECDHDVCHSNHLNGNIFSIQNNNFTSLKVPSADNFLY